MKEKGINGDYKELQLNSSTDKEESYLIQLGGLLMRMICRMSIVLQSTR